MDSLENLVISLNTRLCYFLNMYSSALPQEFIEELMSSLEGHEFFFLEIQPQDKGVIPQYEILRRSLEQARIVSLYAQPQAPSLVSAETMGAEVENEGN